MSLFKTKILYYSSIMDSQIADLVLFIQENIRGEIKDMNYITLLKKVQNIYLKAKVMKEVNSDDEQEDQEEAIPYDWSGQYC